MAQPFVTAPINGANSTGQLADSMGASEPVLSEEEIGEYRMLPTGKGQEPIVRPEPCRLVNEAERRESTSFLGVLGSSGLVYFACWISSISYPSGASTKAITLPPPVSVGPSERG